MTFKPDMIPNEIQDLLQDLAQTDEDVIIQIGKIVLTLIDTLEVYSIDAPRMEIYKACGVWLKRPASTVRNCVYIAKYLPQQIYNDYCDVIGISQFRALISKCDTEDDYRHKLNEWLAYCEEKHLSVTSVDAFRAWLSEEEGDMSITKKRWFKMVNAMERSEGDPNLPDALQRAVKKSLKEIQRQVDMWDLTEWRF